MSGAGAPLFTVVVATFGRGALIEPTLQSIARQRLDDLEVIVVSDGPPAAGLREVVGACDSRFRLEETDRRHRSQSGPNNQGWAHARGQYIAYLGHDDVWHPDHLLRLREGFEAHPDASFTVSGCIYFGPAGTGDDLTWVTGMFDSEDPAVPHEHFFPPSSVAHWREVPVALEPWPDAATSTLPVDSAFLRAAAAAGARFASAGHITVFKFASAQRYLSYLSPDDDEQRDMLELLERPADGDLLIAEKVRAAIANGKYMHSRYSGQPETAPGASLIANERTRGIDDRPVNQLHDSVWIGPGTDSRGFDWHRTESDGARTWRWSGPNHRPRLSLGYFHASPVHVRLHVARFAHPDVQSSLRVLVNREPVDFRVVGRPRGACTVEFVARLRPNQPTVVELRTSRSVAGAEGHPASTDRRRRGIGLVGVELETVDACRLRAHAPGDGSRAFLVHVAEVAKRECAMAVAAIALERDRALAEAKALRQSRLWRTAEWYRRLRARVAHHEH